MKKCLTLLALGLLFAAPGACLCEGAKTTTPDASADATTDSGAPNTTPDAATAADAGAQDAAPTADAGAQADAPTAADAGAQADAPTAADAGAQDDAGAAPAADAGGDAGAEATPAEDAGGTVVVDAKPLPQPEFDEMKMGRVYEGAPSKVIVGTWDVVLPSQKYLDSIPEGPRKEFEAYEGAQLQFDGKKVTLRLKDKTSSGTYQLQTDKGFSTPFTFKGDGLDVSGIVTFNDLDTMTLIFPTVPGPIRASRKL